MIHVSLTCLTLIWLHNATGHTSAVASPHLTPYKETRISNRAINRLLLHVSRYAYGRLHVIMCFWIHSSEKENMKRLPMRSLQTPLARIKYAEQGHTNWRAAPFVFFSPPSSKLEKRASGLCSRPITQKHTVCSASMQAASCTCIPCTPIVAQPSLLSLPVCSASPHELHS